MVRETLADVDVVAFCIPADEKIGPGDRFIARDLADLRAPVVAVVTKADKVSKEALAMQLLAVQELGQWAQIVPVSAVTDNNCFLRVAFNYQRHAHLQFTPTPYRPPRRPGDP